MDEFLLHVISVLFYSSVFFKYLFNIF